MPVCNFSALCKPSQMYSTLEYLYVSLQGSPPFGKKTVLLYWHVSLPSHLYYIVTIHKGNYHLCLAVTYSAVTTDFMLGATHSTFVTPGDPSGYQLPAAQVVWSDRP